MSIMSPAFRKRSSLYQSACSVWWCMTWGGQQQYTFITHSDFLVYWSFSWSRVMIDDGTVWSNRRQNAPDLTFFDFSSSFTAEARPSQYCLCCSQEKYKIGKFCNIVLKLAQVWLQRRRLVSCGRSRQWRLPSPQARLKLHILTIWTLKF